MKTNCSIKFITVAFGLTVFAATGCAEKDKTAVAPLPTAKEVAAAPSSVAVINPNSTAQMAAMASSDVASAKWIDIKDCSYDMRAQFFAGFKQLEARVDGQLSELTARRTVMNSNANTKDWDFAMKEMGNARSYLISVGAELTKASPETWNQQKETVGLAWVRTQAAYDKVKASTTN
jgi:hypothetical protein